MALDSHGNWTPILPDGPPFSPCGFGEVRFCSGVPDAATGEDGDIGINTINSDVYSKANGVWTLIVGGGGSGGGFTVGVVDPNGNGVTGSPGDGYVNTANKTLWIKETGVATDTGWLQFV